MGTPFVRSSVGGNGEGTDSLSRCCATIIALLRCILKSTSRESKGVYADGTVYARKATITSSPAVVIRANPSRKVLLIANGFAGTSIIWPGPSDFFNNRGFRINGSTQTQWQWVESIHGPIPGMEWWGVSSLASDVFDYIEVIA